MGHSIRQLSAGALSFLLVLTASSLVGSSAYAAGPSVSWGGTTSITEGDSATSINSSALAITSAAALDSGYLDFAVTGASASDVFSLQTSVSASTVSGEVSVVGTSVFLGNGTTADNIGSVDDVRNGTGGQSLRVNFVNSFPNASFEADADQSTTVTGWTAVTSQVKLGTTSLAGYVSVDGRDYAAMRVGCSGSGAGMVDDGYYDVISNGFSTRIFQVSVTDDHQSQGSKALRLYMSATGGNSDGWVIHGPAVVSSEFQATANDVISFDWKAIGGGDDYSVYGYIVRVDGPSAGTPYKVLDAFERRDGLRTTFARTTHMIQNTGTYKFVFVGGAHNYDGGSCTGRQGDSQLFIDNVVVAGNKVNASVATNVAKLIRYANTSDAPPASRTATITVSDANGLTGTGTTTINITPVNDAPSIDGDGSTTTVGRTVVEQDADTVENPIANVTGTLAGFDPDGGSPTFTFGISGGTVSGSSVSKVGTYGTLTVNSTTGAYTYVPNMVAIKPLNTGADPVDSFALTVSDGLLTGSGTLAFTIDSITDTEPSTPTITNVIGGNGFLTVLYSHSTPPSIVNFEYSINGGAFRALNPAVTSGPIQISTLSADGTTALVNGTSYGVQLRAVNVGNDRSLASNTVAGTPSNVPSINTPSIQSFDPSTSATAIANDFQVSGFGPTDELLVTIGLSGHGSGTTFALPNFSGSGATVGTGYSSYSGTAVTDLAITGTQSEVNAALSGLRLATGTARSNFSVNVGASVVSGSIVQSGSTQSFYEYVAATSPRLSWDQARAAAETKTFAGVSGYLVTITSAEENAFVASRIPGASNVWIGASDAAVEGDWRWVTGPEGANGGTRFWYSASGVVAGQNITTSYSPPSQTRACTATGSSPVGSLDASLVTYACWASNEPNNADGSRGGEDAVVTNWNSVAGMWNDLAATNSGQISGYVVEYSEWGGQTFSATSVVKTASAVSMGGPQLTASAGALSAALSWTTPSRTGQTVTSYSVSSVPSVAGVSVCTGTATSCTVTGLTAGTNYTFTVTATWTDSATSTSNSSSVTATATPVASSGGGGSAGPVVPPTVVQPPRVLPRVLPTPPPVVGPVLSGGTSTPPSAPTALVGGRPLAIQTQVTDPNTMSLRAGVLNIGMNVASDQGSVRQQGSSTEIQVRNGGVASVTGSGVLPRSTVQVFMPLQGSNAREIARIPVDATGSFSGDALFGATPSETPLPIGRHVLQMVTVDENRQQTVVELTVNIAQPPPAPELNRSTNERPALLPGQSIATNAGQPEAVTVVALPDQKQARVEGDGWLMAVDVPNADGRVSETPEGGAVLELVRDETAVVSGSGFMPGTRADVWLFSDPTLLGTVDIDENGEFNGEINVDGNVVAAGEHTLQLQGVGEDGFVRAANLGVVVNDAAPVSTEAAASGFLWWVWVLVLLLVVAVLVFALWRYRRATQ